MPYLSRISHPNKAIGEKVNYFHNTFLQANFHLGKVPKFTFKTPYYIVYSIDYQLVTNRDRCYPYVSALLLSLSDFDLELIEACGVKKEYVDTLKKLKESAKEHRLRQALKDALEEKPRIFKFLKKQLNDNQLSVLITKLINKLGCKHKLRTHKKLLEYLATTLVSIYRFEGFSKRLTRESFNSIFAKNKDFFPYPKEINDIEDKNKRTQAKQEYFKSRDFIKIFRAVFDTINREMYNPHVIVKILHVENRDGEIIDFRFNGMRVISPNHELAQEIKIAIADNGHHRDFFKHENYLVCLLQIGTPSNVGEKRDEVYSKVDSVVRYVNTRLNDTKAVTDRHEYLTTVDFKRFSSGFSSSYPNVTLGKNDNFILTDNASNYLEEINEDLSSKLLLTQELYWDAKISNDLVKMWQYLENDYPENGRKEVCKVATGMLLSRKRQMIEDIYYVELEHALSVHSAYNQLEYPDELISEIKEYNSSNLDVRYYTKHSKNEFLRSLGLEWKAVRARTSISDFGLYWNSLLEEARGYRNMVMHDGAYNRFLKTRLEVCLPYLITNYRYACIDLVLKNKNKKNYDRLLLKEVEKYEY